MFENSGPQKFENENKQTDIPKKFLFFLFSILFYRFFIILSLSLCFTRYKLGPK